MMTRFPKRTLETVVYPAFIHFPCIRRIETDKLSKTLDTQLVLKGLLKVGCAIT